MKAKACRTLVGRHSLHYTTEGRFKLILAREETDGNMTRHFQLWQLCFRIAAQGRKDRLQELFVSFDIIRKKTAEVLDDRRACMLSVVH